MERKVGALAAIDPVAALALGVILQDLALRALDEADEGGDDHHRDGDEERGERMHRPRAYQLQRAGDGVRQAGGDAGEDDDRDAVAEAALGDLLAEPHQEHGAGDEGSDRRDTEHEAGVEHQVRLRLEHDRDAGRLEQREEHRPVARVLRDLAAAGLAFLAQLVELRADRSHQLPDDRRRDVRHDAEREDREAPQRAAREHVEHAEHAALVVLEETGQDVRVDARHRDVRADAEHDECPEQEQQALFQVAVARPLAGVGQSCHQLFGASFSSAASAFFGFFSFTFFSTFGFSVMWIEPPAASIMARAPLLTRISFSATLRSSLPERITFAPSARCDTMPSALSTARSMSVAFMRASSLVRTSGVSSRVGELKPRLGRRRCSGICPPSKPTLWYPPARSFCPSCPRPAVLPQPEPTPPPTRSLSLFEPGAGFSVF